MNTADGSLSWQNSDFSSILVPHTTNLTYSVELKSDWHCYLGFPWWWSEKGNDECQCRTLSISKECARCQRVWHSSRWVICQKCRFYFLFFESSKLNINPVKSIIRWTPPSVAIILPWQGFCSSTYAVCSSVKLKTLKNLLTDFTSSSYQINLALSPWGSTVD